VHDLDVCRKDTGELQLRSFPSEEGIKPTLGQLNLCGRETHRKRELYFVEIKNNTVIGWASKKSKG
jgi:hypothetical protein